MEARFQKDRPPRQCNATKREQAAKRVVSDTYTCSAYSVHLNASYARHGAPGLGTCGPPAGDKSTHFLHAQKGSQKVQKDVPRGPDGRAVA